MSLRHVDLKIDCDGVGEHSCHESITIPEGSEWISDTSPFPETICIIVEEDILDELLAGLGWERDDDEHRCPRCSELYHVGRP